MAWPEGAVEKMNGFVDVVAQLGAMVLSFSLGLLIVWGSLVGFFRVLSAEQPERVRVPQHKSHGLESSHAPRQP
jgi:hypothetical protein